MPAQEYQIQHRRDDGLSWSIKNPVLANGEIGIDQDTGKFKMGNGVARWNALPYYLREDHIAAYVTSRLSEQSTEAAGFGPVYEQVTPSSSWSITHALGRYPAVTVLDTDGNVVFADVTYVSLTQIHISFGDPTAGKAVLT